MTSIETTTNQLPTNSLYEQDFYIWIETTIKILRDRQFNQLDIDNLIEEIETMGRSEKRELINRLRVLIEHLLKLIYWEQVRVENQRGWLDTIVEQRRQIQELLKDSPSLKPLLSEIFTECYTNARKDVLIKTNFPSNKIPTDLSFTLEQTLDINYLP
ncbi:DUF29 domain-containing protein [Anabaena cylindrica FACHB-243]|uniref:DUF29 domain-containing protein n=1 Tax=Anabaena cylindrica (strain ATCC 27899 / PCC 7122) TaxID=272123 RepID=K9ZF59_ANACC|nr:MULTISPECIES: DUF29 domain-containing protein [Anabaena]AFZ57853.1 protein of unknown function DUF29 [Anabaena cylindrica PCC 7122]MBD2418264.1 DUF29 domain-containing protein [Anabaena cylindrica FACHB-243]MBY5281507.1 DUF29 domain-containing protein [Anabaena sp. CCAP 1446/1C]MBY5307239.1 DUF29 domain-containing protein [Anabaena sp. CCAP 1446/1C]MCM2405605.1 DUF29 domain-containing protein [Anabaena sp. CCAP 1446/1C]